MNNEQLKADKVRVLADLNCIKNEYISDPDFALENLDMLGFDIGAKGKITIKTPGGYFKFMIERIDQITELVEMHYPENLENSFTNSCQDNEDEIQDALTDASHNFTTALKSKNEGLINLFRSELDKVLARKDALLYA